MHKITRFTLGGSNGYVRVDTEGERAYVAFSLTPVFGDTAETVATDDGFILTLDGKSATYAAATLLLRAARLLKQDTD